jgi:hypothetical protein
MTSPEITDAAVEVACQAHTPQWARLDTDIKKYARGMMRAALTAAVQPEPRKPITGGYCAGDGYPCSVCPGVGRFCPHSSKGPRP